MYSSSVIILHSRHSFICVYIPVAGMYLKLKHSLFRCNLQWYTHKRIIGTTVTNYREAVQDYATGHLKKEEETLIVVTITTFW